jgi:dihydropteroate synthase
LAAPHVFPPDRVTIVGVLNCTPDSFSDGGALVGPGGGSDRDAVLRAAEGLIEGGAHVLDVGGESTRPGAAEVPASLERQRVVPAIEALAKRFEVPISVDTRKGEVAEAALAAGARIVNDVSGGCFDPALPGVVAQAGGSLVLGHLRGTPETMQRSPHFDDVLEEVASELEATVGRARAAGLGDDQLAVDPGIGFGKDLAANLELLAHAGWLRQRLGLPLLVGPSRKSFLGTLTGDPVECRDEATAAACAVAVFAGADAVRVHAPAAVVRAVAVGRALRTAQGRTLRAPQREVPA